MPYARGDYASRGDLFGFLGKAIGTVASFVGGPVGGIVGKVLGSISTKPPSGGGGSRTMPGMVRVPRGRAKRARACR